MMQKLRSRYVMKKILWAILILTIPSFVLFYGFSGTGGSGGQPELGNTYVEIKTDKGPREITRNDMAVAKDSLAYYYAQFGGQNASQSYLTQIRSALTNKEVADHAISMIAMRQLGQNWGIEVSPQQVSRELSNQGLSREGLQNYLQRSRISEAEFVRRQSDALRSSRTEQLVGSIARVSLLEVWQEYLLQNEELKAKYAVLRPGDLTDTIDVTEAEAREYFESHRGIYIEPEQRVYRYIKREPAPIDFAMQIPESESRALYDAMDPKSQSEYAAPEGIQVRHILMEVPEDQTAEAIREQMEQIRQRIEAGEDFAELANAFSDDIANIGFDAGTTATLRGGLLPERVVRAGRDAWIEAYGEAWLQAVVNAAEGEMTPVVEGPDQNSFLLARVESISEGGLIPFEEARPRIERQLRQEKIRKQQEQRDAEADKIELELRELVATRTTLEGVARELSQDVQVTSPTVATSTNIRGVGSFRNNETALSRLELGTLSPVLRSDQDALVVMEIAEILPERQQEFDEVRDQVTRALKQERASVKAVELANQIRERVAQGQDLKTVAEEMGAEFTETADAFTRMNAPGELRSAANFRYASLRAQIGEPEVVKSGFGDYVNAALVFVLTEKNPPEKAEFIENMRQLESSLRSLKYRAFLQEFRQDALTTMKPVYKQEMFGEEQL